MNRRNFLGLAGLGLFSILPGAGRVWKAEKQVLHWIPAREMGPLPPDIQEMFKVLYQIQRQRRHRLTDENYEMQVNKIVLHVGTRGIYEKLCETTTPS